jgi:membrane-associated protease RseP (regulator of RpoE activity)
MAILLSHELGHYFVARRHHVDVSPPYFIPMPFTFIGTFGAVIRMRGPVESRDALLDIGAAGPLAGFIVTLPVLIYGIATSPVEPLDPKLHYLVEGHSLLYSGLIYALKGPLAEGYDILLSPTALAGWAGLLVTMMNLVPVGQLDGGHVAYALFGARQDAYSRRVLQGLLALALLISGWAMLNAWQRGGSVIAAASAGMHWGIWWLLLRLMTRANGGRHPPTAPSELSSARRMVAWSTLLLFVLLFMPTWISET